MNGAPDPQRSARAPPLVGPYPIDEDALRRLKRLHDGGVIDDYTFRCRKAEALGLRKAARTRLSLLHLPADVLSKIASHAVVPALVVAAGKQHKRHDPSLLVPHRGAANQSSLSAGDVPHRKRVRRPQGAHRVESTFWRDVDATRYSTSTASHDD